MPRSYLDYTALIGGKERVLESVTQAIKAGDAREPNELALHFAKTFATEGIAARVMAEFIELREVHAMLYGERPCTPCPNMTAWDQGFRASVAGRLEAFAMPHGIPAEDIRKRYKSHIVDNATMMNQVCLDFAMHLVMHDLGQADTVNKQLSRMGITTPDIEQAVAGGAVDYSLSAPTLAADDLFVAGDQTPPLHAETAYPAEDVTHTATIYPAAAKPQGRKGRPRAKGEQGLVLPGSLFVDVRGLGVSDVAGSEATGIKRSSWSRVASGTASEIGVTAEQATAMHAWLQRLENELAGLRGILEIYGVEPA